MVGGLKLGEQPINSQMARRQAGFGRGARMKMERDTVQILSGTRRGSTIGSPIALMIKNRDFSIDRLPQVRCPRPGHADLAGAIKYNSADIRDVLERASARETAARVAVGAICKVLLGEFDVQISSRVVMIGGVSAKNPRLMNARIASCAKKGDTLGGIFEVVARGVCAGLGSFAQSDRRLDGRLAGALMSIQAIKGVEIGLGFESAKKCGSQVHDAIYYAKTKGFYRSTNNAGGLEGGVTNGEPVVIRCAMKPISTLANPLASVDINSKRPSRAAVERSDVCAVQSAGVVAEAAMAFELAAAMLEKFGGDSLGETKRNFDGYLKQVKSF
jgi:chorismate synthase